MYTIRNRNSLFETYTTQLGILTRKVYAGQTKGLDHNLLFDFVYAGLNCHGFGERQKYTLLRYANLTEKDVKMSKFCRSWPFDIVGKKFGMDDENVEVGLKAASWQINSWLTLTSHFSGSSSEGCRP